MIFLIINALEFWRSWPFSGSLANGDFDPQARISQFNSEDAPFSGYALEGMHSAIGELKSGARH